MITLSPRLKAAADMVQDTKRFIDVGCDHGYLSAYMLQEKGAEFAYACDINQGPLDNASKTAVMYGLGDKIECRLCNGLDTFSSEDCDTVFICGMGGELIADILSHAPWTVDGNHTMILQPMTRAEKLRRFLYENGYYIELEMALEDDKRIYCVMMVKGGKGDCGENNQFLFSDQFIKDAFFDKYIGKLLQKYKAVLDGKLAASKSVAEEEEIIRLLEEAYAHR